MREKILFIGHDASRTGAPLLMLELIKWLLVHSDIQPSVLLKRGGEIESQYREVAPTRRCDEEYERVNSGTRLRLLRRLGILGMRTPDWAGLYPPEQYPVVYANTIDTCDIALQLTGPGRQLVNHIHELSYCTGLFGVGDILRKAVPVTNVYIAASQAVREHLEQNIGAPASRIHVIHEFPIHICKEGCQSETGRALRRQLGIFDDAFVIGMCGVPHWRKGTDLFVQLAMHVKHSLGRAKCHFVWLGGDLISHREALHDVTRMGLQDTCHFLPSMLNPEACFSAFDLFALTSREEPFSVAMLEAAARGLPIVCFAGAGGAPEFVENDSGAIVPYLDVPAMAKACVDLLLDENRRRQIGDNARAKVNARYTLDLLGPKLLAVLESQLNIH